ncbi:MAG: winged helix-turn-helix domain-containing protein [Cyanobacteria bacterium P01_G01_bin.39]
MSQVTGKKVSRMRGWEYLKQMEYSLKVPRTEHLETSLTEQQDIPLTPVRVKKISLRD